MDSVNRLSSCKFEPLVDVALPEKAVVWTANQYYDGSGETHSAALNGMSKLSILN